MKFILTAITSCMAALSLHAQHNTNVFFHEMMVVEKDDTSVIEGTDLGSIKFADKGFKVHCSYFDAMSYLVAQCREKGGNLIKLTAIKSPDGWSSCYRITAEAYKVNDPRKYEKDTLDLFHK